MSQCTLLTLTYEARETDCPEEKYSEKTVPGKQYGCFFPEGKPGKVTCHSKKLIIIIIINLKIKIQKSYVLRLICIELLRKNQRQFILCETWHSWASE